MQRTKNYQLPQWETEDRIMMKDFNDAMSSIENAIDGAKSEASSAVAAARSEASSAVAAARSEASSAVESVRSQATAGIAEAKSKAEGAASAAGEARTIAERAESKAGAAQAKADQAYCPDNKPYKAGTYMGASQTQTIETGFRPSAVIIAARYNSVTGYRSSFEDPNLFSPLLTSSDNYISFSNSGFSVAPQKDSLLDVSVNQSGYAYLYIAFR